MIHNRSVKKYLRRVRETLPCSGKMKKCIMEQICNEISLFLEEQPKADYNAMISRFGEPETIAASYVENMGTAEILKQLRIRKRILSIVAILLIFILVTWATAVTIEIQDNHSASTGYATTTIK